MITIGVDAHKRVNEACAIDESGAEVSRWRGANDAKGWTELRSWVEQLGRDRCFGIEGAWSFGRGLAQSVVAGGDTVYEVNPRWTALMRRGARRVDKSDHLDSRAVALFVRQEAPDLPEVAPEDETVSLDLLTVERENANAEAVRLRNQIHALLAQLDPRYYEVLPSLTSAAGVQAVKEYSVPAESSAAHQTRAACVRRIAARLELAVDQVTEIARQIRLLAAPRFEALTELCGINLLTAGMLAGILGPGRRFRTDAEMARYAGVAPIEASSGQTVRHRLNRGGNRRLNAILYRIVLTQAHYSPDARTYLDRRMSEGRTRREAYRALKRYLIRAIFRLWNRCLAVADTPMAPRSSFA